MNTPIKSRFRSKFFPHYRNWKLSPELIVEIQFKNVYHKIASSNTPHLEAHAYEGNFRETTKRNL